MKVEVPIINDEDWLKTTVASYSSNGPIFRYEDVDTSIIKPRLRRYDVAKEASNNG